MSNVLLILGVAAVFAFLLYRMHEKKKDDPVVSYWVETETMHIIVPAGIPREAAEMMAKSLEDAYISVWDKLAEIYEVEAPRRIIGLVTLVEGPVEPNHPFVSWHQSTNRVRLQIKDDMVMWFALELHITFRVAAFGYDSVYNFISDDDRKKAQDADKYIEDEYGVDHEQQ